MATSRGQGKCIARTIPKPMTMISRPSPSAKSFLTEYMTFPEMLDTSQLGQAMTLRNLSVTILNEYGMSIS
ncbi:MAG: hypothetical protein MJZ33_06905 [Paludibacteraceae bacterium]|nr:hypothetical protein [Paludibacteraceae bacterium]